MMEEQTQFANRNDEEQKSSGECWSEYLLSMNANQGELEVSVI